MGIIVVTYAGSPWLSECIASLEGCKYPIYLCINPKEDCPFDPGALFYAEEHNIKTFVVLHDSMVVKDQKVFDMLFEKEGNVAVYTDKLSCLGKFELKSLLPLPNKPNTKSNAVDFEIKLREKFDDTLGLVPNKREENKNGRLNRVEESDYLIKYKGTWTGGMAERYKL